MHSATQKSEVVGTSTCAAARVAEEYLGNSWDPLTVVQRMDFIEANRISPCSMSRLPLDEELSGLVAGTTTLSSCDNGRSQEDMSSFPLYGNSHMNGCETNTKGNKRKIVENLKAEEQHDVSSECFKYQPGKDEKKHKNGLSSTTKNAQGSKDVDASKDDFIHVRAKRGQATNSHSLAERVRREKISERMRLLQDLVPGCSKINGKAMMLDEIINYVQSLQRQVEFLSMKLAAAHPGLNFAVEQLLSKQVLQSCYGGPSVLGFGPGMSSFQSQLYVSTSQGLTQPEMLYIAPSSGDLQQASLLQMSHMPLQLANTWHDELQNTLQMNSIPSESTPTDHNGADPLVGGFESF